MPRPSMTPSLRRLGAAATATLLLLGLSGCSGATAPVAGSTAVPAPATPSPAASPAATSPAAAIPSGPAASPGTPPATHPTPVGVTPATPAEIVARSTVPILCYHQVRPLTAEDSAYARSITVTPKRFAQQIDALRAAGFHTITPDQLRAHLVTGATLPSRPILITFDDGTRPQWTTAGPVLTRAGFTATYFPMTVVLGKKGWLHDADLRAMHAAGFAIGSHTWDHHDVREYTAKDWRTQLTGSLATLQEAIGAPVTTFAYPYGAWNDDALAPLSAAGVQIAFQLTDKPVSTKAPLLTQRRLLMLGAWTGQDLLDRIAETFPQG